MHSLLQSYTYAKAEVGQPSDLCFETVIKGKQ